MYRHQGLSLMFFLLIGVKGCVVWLIGTSLIIINGTVNVAAITHAAALITSISTTVSFTKDKIV